MTVVGLLVRGKVESLRAAKTDGRSAKYLRCMGPSTDSSGKLQVTSMSANLDPAGRTCCLRPTSYDRTQLNAHRVCRTTCANAPRGRRGQPHQWGQAKSSNAVMAVLPLLAASSRSDGNSVMAVSVEKLEHKPGLFARCS